MNGLEQLQAWIAQGAQPAIGKTLQFELVEATDGRAVFQGVPGLHAYNPIGSVHGGYTATLLDSACGCAVHTKLSATQGYTTLELKVSYLRGLTKDSGLVRTEGTVLSIGKRVAFAEAKLVDSSGRLCATATSTLLVFDKKPASPTGSAG